MNVDQLIDQIGAIYPRATPEAVKAMKPVYHTHLDRYAGNELQAAAEEVFGSYKSTVGEPFPKPVEFRAVLSTRVRSTGDDKSIRPALEARTKRLRENIVAWINGQGLKIKQARHAEIYRACLAMAQTECGRPSWQRLSQEQFRRCEQRAISQERVRRFGAMPKSDGAWWSQITTIAEEWGTPVRFEDWEAKQKPREAA